MTTANLKDRHGSASSTSFWFSKKVWITTLAVIVIAAAGGIAWSMWPDPDVQRVKEIQQQLFSEDIRDMDPEKRREMFGQMREAQQNLTESQRREMGREMRQGFENRMTQHVTEYFDLPAAQRTAFLDQDIDRMEQMRKQFAQWRQQREQSGDRGGDRGAGRGGPREGGGPGARGGGGGGGRGWGGPDGRGRPRTEEERTDRKRDRLDNSSPEVRAYMEAYREAINKRREERGLEPFERGFRGGPRR